MHAQSLLHQKKSFTRADTLRGTLLPERNCYDVHFYELNIQVDTGSRTINGQNTIAFNAVQDFTRMQIDLFENMEVKSITHKGNVLSFSREFNAVFIDFPSMIKKGEQHELVVRYGGKPIIAKRAPWDGGFVWTYDTNGNLWAGVSCEGIGASLWWPNKDHPSDEPDSMRIICSVPWGLKCIANGNMEDERRSMDGYMTYSWFVSYPINNYNVTLNIGDYAHFSDRYTAADGDILPLDYYVLRPNVAKAKTHFAQVKPMLECYEKYLGKYPFWNDGYALVETPYLGMEHQGAIAYGNKFRSGYNGIDFSRIGLTFDYIIIHETGHEWWGNSVSCNDMADMWIHESFCTYSEAIYVECMHGYDTAMLYVNAKKPTVDNKAPIVGIYGVNEEGDGDMYNKGMLFLNTLRHHINNDPLWWGIIKSMSDTVFKHRVISYNDIVEYMSERTSMQLQLIFDQYLKHAAIPTFEYSLKKVKGKEYELSYRWVTDVPGFKMRAYLIVDGKPLWVDADNNWFRTGISIAKEKEFRVDESKAYINVKRY